MVGTMRTFVLLIAAFLLLSCSSNDTRVDLPDNWPDFWVDDKNALSKKDLERLNAESDFSVARQVANEYLVLTVVVSESDVKPIKSQLVRGPEKANSALGQIEIRALAGGTVAMSYTTQNPRLTKREGRTWSVSPSAGMVIFVPLQSTLDSVEIRPVPGQQYTISKKVEFDPLPWAIRACHNDERGFSACEAIKNLPQYESWLPDTDTLQ